MKRLCLVCLFVLSACTTERVIYQRVTVPSWLTDLPDAPTIDPQTADSVEVGHFIIDLDRYARFLRARITTIKDVYGAADD